MKKLGKYIIQKKLGSGAMGDVWLGYHPNLEIPVAIKTLSPKVSKNPVYVERFVKEAKFAAKISHNNIVTIYDADCSNNIHYIVMEYIAGESLGQRLEREKKLDEKEALRITLAVVEALIAAKNNNIVHRDIKPDNIMITESGAVKLADLGIAKQLDSEIATTKAHDVLGTPIYMSPEQIRSSGVDFRSDIYSLGCTLFHLVVGKIPYQGESVMSMMAQHLEKEVPESKSINVNLSNKINNLIHKMMQKSPEQRYQSLEELETDIKKCLSDKIEVSPNSKKTARSSRLREQNKSNLKKTIPIYIPVVAILILCIVLGILSGISTLPESKDSEPISIEDLRITMLPVMPGNFQMGSTSAEREEAGRNVPVPYNSEETLHAVEITQSYWLSQHEVTQYSFSIFAEQTNYRTNAERQEGQGYLYAPNWQPTDTNWRSAGYTNEHPIVMVSYNDCLAFCDWLTERERQNGKIPSGYKYTLPTEAQWEYACRAGSTETFSGGIPLIDQGFYAANSEHRLQVIGQKTPNTWGFYDMHGNVAEFCLDRCYGRPYFNVRTNTYTNTTDPLSEEGETIIFRGGSWPDPAKWCRAAFRGNSAPTYRCNNHGFRLALIKE